ncbi:MAG: Ig-like domain-containing protein [Nanobdellota archaeon]
MKNKILLTLAISLILFSGIGSVLAKDIAYIAKDAAHRDVALVTLLDEGGYTYDIIYQNSLLSTDFSNYSIILVGEGIFSNPSQIPVNTKNSVILNTYHIDDWFWSDNGISTKSSNYPTEVYVFDEGSSIVNGVGETFIPYNTDGVMLSYTVKYIPKSLDAPDLETIVADGLSFLKLLGINTPKNGAAVATITNGSQLRGGHIAQARGVFLGFTDTELWTEDTKTVFYNSLDWAMSGEDRDGDGFLTDLDCNDKDASINPDAEEIPYDSVDQDCSGGDLNDLDEDGFVAEVAGGNDCDDEDPEYNIESEDLSKNCVNDAPIIEMAYRFSAQEKDIAIITINAHDPEEDEISYEINDSRFVQDLENESIFTWETDYEDEGDYKFFAIASDGEKESSQEFILKVWNRNKAPELLMDIPDQEWEEDGNHTLNLTEYFYDLDEDQLYYLFHDTSSNVEISLLKIENGVAYFDSAENWYGEDWIMFKITDGINVVLTNNITLRVLPVNDAPVLIEEIGTIEIDEDETYYLDLDEYIEDVDDELEYTIENTSHITLIMEGDVLKITPEEEWSGEEDAIITVDDGEYELSENFTIRVLPMNDAPELSLIEDKLVLAGWKVEVSASATDKEGDEFNFSINDSRFVQDEVNKNQFGWQTGEDDFGIHTFKVLAYDGNSYGYTEFKVNALQKIFINEFVWGSEGWVEVYNPKTSTFDLSGCKLTNGAEDITLYGTLGNHGFASFGWNALENNGEIQLICEDILMDDVEYEEFSTINSLGRKTDGFNDDTEGSFKIFDYPTKGVSNGADITKPQVELEGPENNTLYTENRDVLFEFFIKDNMADNLECGVVVNSKILEKNNFANNTQGSFFIDYLNDGVYLWNIECSDGTNKDTAPESWMMTISAPDLPILSKIGNKNVNENNELRFNVHASDPDNDAIELTISQLPEGAEFKDNGNGNGQFIWMPGYNQSGTYDLEFTAEDATGMKDSERIKILVGNTKEPPKFSDADVCSSEDNNSSIEITIKDPDNGDDFEIGDIINGTVKIKNKFEDKMEFKVKVYLYDSTEEEVLKEFEEEVDIKEGKSEDVDFSLEVPNDIEGSEFAIYAYVEGEDDECNSQYIEIEIEREKHKVIISEINVDREDISPGDELKVEVKAENLGREDEDVVISVGIDALNIYQESDEFEIEKYGEDDKETEVFYISIPKETKYGYYDIKAIVAYEDGEDSELKEIIVAGRVTGTTEVQENKVISLNYKPVISSTGGRPLTLGNTNDTTPSGNNLIIVNKETSKKTSQTRLFSQTDSVNLGVNEKITREYNPEVKIEFDGEQKSHKISANQWVILAIVLGLLVIVILVLIFFLRRNH